VPSARKVCEHRYQGPVQQIPKSSTVRFVLMDGPYWRRADGCNALILGRLGDVAQLAERV
jgi:hypothetical protein